MALSLFNDPFVSDIERSMQQAMRPFLGGAGASGFPSSLGGLLAGAGGPMMGAITTASAMHPMDVVEHADRYSIVADAPGMSPDNIHIELSGDTLNVSGEKRVERHHRDQQGGVKMHRTERTFNKFSRTFSLPDDAQADGITARIDNGVLTVDIPKMAKEAGRTAPVRIRVAGGNEPAPAIAPGAAAGAGDVTGAGAEVGGTTASGNVPVTTTSAGGEGAGLESSAVPPTV